jgi:hypothetical protein
VVDVDAIDHLRSMWWDVTVPVDARRHGVDRCGAE